MTLFFALFVTYLDLENSLHLEVFGRFLPLRKELILQR